MTSVDESTNRWIREEAEAMCRAAGIDPVPMTNPNFDFYGYGVKHTSFYGLRGANLYDTVHDIIQRIFFPITRKDETTVGTMYTFPRWYREHPDRGFDDYFILNFKQESIDVDRWRKRKKRRPGIPITLGTDAGDPGGGISEEVLEGKSKSPLSILEDREEQESLHRIPALLSEQERNSHLLLFVWDRLKQGKELTTIAEELNEQSQIDPEYLPPRGGVWSASTVGRLREKIQKLARERFGKRSISLSSRYKIVSVGKPGRVTFLPQRVAL